jgi:hypothetical protein
MSKNMGKTAISKITQDLYPSSKPQNFKLCSPPNFDFFNSLRHEQTDIFAGVTVVLFKSVLWINGNGVTSQAQADGTTYYSGSYSGELPLGVAAGPEKHWVAVISKQLDSLGTSHAAALTGQGCVENTEFKEASFMFLRAHDLLSFDETLRLRASEEISYQPMADDYKCTAVSDLYPFYEPFALYEVDDNSPLAGRGVFWYSYLVASAWKTLPNHHVTRSAIQVLQKVYEENLSHFLIENARIGITAAHFTHTFVDLYRCLEWLYSIPRARMVKEHLSLTIKTTELSRVFRAKLGWRRTELDSLILLISDCELNTLDMELISRCMLEPLPVRPVRDMVCQDGQPKTENEWREAVAQRLAKRIYDVRNKIVHQLDQYDEPEVKKDQEPLLIELLAILCIRLYSKYAKEL